MGISASMANAVTPEVANELTFRFAFTYLSIISAFSSHEGQWGEQYIHPHPWGIKEQRTLEQLTACWSG